MDQDQEALGEASQYLESFKAQNHVIGCGRTSVILIFTLCAIQLLLRTS